MPVSFFVNVNVLPCPKDVTSYLEVSYRCLPGKYINTGSTDAENVFSCVYALGIRRL